MTARVAERHPLFLFVSVRPTGQADLRHRNHGREDGQPVGFQFQGKSSPMRLIG